ncbi:MAG: hypothetical protein PHW69_09815, partial [Elusimicrobiaceae bacterium]|nr:hypothetical protein [Elusimicrobiaceae bacterium]
EPYWAKEEEVRLELTSSGKSFTVLSADIEENRGALARTEESLNAQRSRLNSELVKGNSLEHELGQARQLLKTADERLDSLGSARQKFTEQETRHRAGIAKLKTELERLRAEQNRIRREGEELKVRRAAAQTKTSALKNEQDSLNTELYEYKIRRGSLESDLRGAETEHVAAVESAGQRAGRRGEAELRIEELGRDRATAEAELAQTRDRLAELEVSETTLREQLSDSKREFDEKSRTAYALKTETTDIQMKAHEAEMEYRSHLAQKDAALEELRERHNTTAEEAAMKYSDYKIDYERIKMMRRQIENMGAVNMTAPEEYDALSSRYEFLKTQINDLETARRDLRTAIGKINATTKENFRATFEKVRESFRRIYQTLFEGGEADLLLTDPENLLETGIEIVAQPPGKRLQNIRALSGGEKALTALSLLFSFFVVNPSPFCIMDEADAPLDEANVERFVNLLREFAGQTQFIVITHNKRTMEAADRLYGVTMQESGVSKVMSVSLQFAEQTFGEDRAAAAV